MKKIIFLAFIIIGCSPEEKEKDDFSTTPVNLNIGSTENCAETRTYCANCDYEDISNLIAVQYLDSELKFTISELDFTMYFDPQIENNITLETLRNNFEYLAFVIRFPEQETDSTSFVYSHNPNLKNLDEPSEEGFILTFENYNDGVLTGSLTGTITEIDEYRRSEDPNCVMDDVMGICKTQISVKKEVTVDFNFCLE